MLVNKLFGLILYVIVFTHYNTMSLQKYIFSNINYWVLIFFGKKGERRKEKGERRKEVFI